MVVLNPISTVSRSSLIGVGIACGGNILISLALTLQKLAHRRNQEEAVRNNGNNHHDEDDDTSDEETIRDSSISKYKHNGSYNGIPPSPIPEEETPCPSPRKTPKSSTSTDGAERVVEAVPVVLLPDTTSNSSSSSRLELDGKGKSRSSSPTPTAIRIPEQVKHVQLNSPTIPTNRSDLSNGPDHERDSNDNYNNGEEGGGGGEVKEGEYLKSRLWWLGQILITIGEGGNFLSYGFAPASVVAPLGTVALIANCIFAPLILRERFHRRELFGMALAIIGAITVVWSSNGSNPRLNPSQLLSALKRLPFIIYTSINLLLLITLILLSNSSYGHKYLLVDIGVCTLFGGYTVLSTKALSSLLSNDFIGSWNFGITWFLVLMVACTSVGQVRWLNRALMRFQSKEVIPTQFVFFSLAAIIGSAVLYEEFKDVPFSSFVNFAFGIATTFLGVHLLTSTPSSENYDSDESESIHSNTNNAPPQPQRASSSASLNLLLPSSASITSANGERQPILVTSPISNFQTPSTSTSSSSAYPYNTIQRYNSSDNSFAYGTTPTSGQNKVRLVRIGSNGNISPALGIGSQAGLLLLATTPPPSSSGVGPGTLGRGRSSSRAHSIGIIGEEGDVEGGDRARDGSRTRAGTGKKRGNTSATRRQ